MRGLIQVEVKVIFDSSPSEFLWNSTDISLKNTLQFEPYFWSWHVYSFTFNVLGSVPRSSLPLKQELLILQKKQFCSNSQNSCSLVEFHRIFKLRKKKLIILIIFWISQWTSNTFLQGWHYFHPIDIYLWNHSILYKK